MSEGGRAAGTVAGSRDIPKAYPYSFKCHRGVIWAGWSSREAFGGGWDRDSAVPPGVRGEFIPTEP